MAHCTFISYFYSMHVVYLRTCLAQCTIKPIWGHNLYWIFLINSCIISSVTSARQQRSGLERSPCKRKVGCSNPCRDIPKSFKQVRQLHCQTLGVRSECHGSSEITIINGLRSCSTLKKRNCSTCRAQVEICSPSPASVTSPMNVKLSSRTKNSKQKLCYIWTNKPYLMHKCRCLIN